MTEENYEITRWCRIEGNSIISSQGMEWACTNSGFDNFADQAYRNMEINYPKFHKMDRLSRLAFLTAEVLFKDILLGDKYNPEDCGILITNRSSSLDSDMKYYELVKKGIASPAAFVYTLPNIMIGEICIRHRIKGENCFFIASEYDIESNVDYVNMLMKGQLASCCVCGWVELFEENFNSFLYFVEKSNTRQHPVHSPENIQNLHTKKTEVWKS